MNFVGVKTIVCSAERIKLLADLKRAGELPVSTHIIYFDEAESDDILHAA